MPNSVDERIVQMQFDNARFEKNIHQSIKSLEELDKTLEMKNATKGFEDLEKAANSVDLSKLERAADVIEKRFSVAGIAGAAAIERGVNGAINLVGKLGSTVVNLAKSGGINRALNLEHANFMLEGLLKDSQKVAEIMGSNGPVQKSVKGTAYGLDAAAKAASQFVASGIKDMDKLESSLTAISGVAAMTGAQYEEIADIFTSTAGKGRAMTMEFNRIAQRGVNAFATLAEYLHTTEEEVREMAKHGEISFQMFSDAMSKAFGDQAKKANETFTGALSNVKAALSRLGAKIAAPTIELLRKMLVALIDVIDKINEIMSNGVIQNLNNIIDRVLSFITILIKQKKFIDLVSAAVENSNKMFTMFSRILTPIGKSLKALVPKDALDNMISLTQGFGKLIDHLTLSAEKATYLQMTLTGLMDIIDLILTGITNLIGMVIPGVDNIFDATDKLSTKILKFTAIIGFFIDKFHDFVKEAGLFSGTMNFINYITGGAANGFIIVSQIVANASRTMHTFGLALSGIVYIIGSAIVNIINYISQLDAVRQVIASIEIGFLRVAKVVLPVIFAIGDAIAYAVDTVMALARGNVRGVFNDIVSTLGPANGMIKDITGSLSGLFRVFQKSKPAMDGVETIVVKSQELMDSGNKIVGTTHTITKGVSEVGEATEQTTSLMERIIGRIKEVMSNLIDIRKLFAVGFVAAVVATIVNIAKAMGRLSRTIRSFGRIADSITDFFLTLGLSVRAFALVELATAITLFAGSLFLLSKFADPKRLLASAGAIAALGVVLGVLAFALSKLDLVSIMKLQMASKPIIIFSAALYILASALAKLARVDGGFAQIAIRVAALGVLMIALATVSSIMGSFNNRKVIRGGTQLIKFAGAVYVCAVALEKLGTLDLDKASAAIPVMLKIMGGLALVVLAAGLSFSPVGGFTMIGVVTSVLLLFKAMEQLTTVDPDVLEQVESLIGYMADCIKKVLWLVVLFKMFEAAQSLFDFLLVKIQGFATTMRKIFIVAEKGIKYAGIGVFIASIGATFYAIASAIEKIGKLNNKELIQGSIVAGIIYTVVVFTIRQLMEMANELATLGGQINSIQTTLLSIGGCLFLIAATVGILSRLSPDQYSDGMKRLLGVSALMLAFVAVLNIINKKIGPMMNIGLKTSAGIGLMILAMVSSLAILGIIPIEMLLQGILGLQVVTIDLMGILLMMSSMAPEIAAASSVMWALAAVIAAYGAVAIALSFVDPVTTLGNITFMTLGIVALATMANLLAPMAATLQPALIAMAEMTGIFGAMALVGLILNQIDPMTFLKNCGIMLGAIGVLSLFALGLGAIFMTPVFGEAVMVAIGALTSLGTAMLAFGAGVALFGIGAVAFGFGANLIADALVRFASSEIDMPTLSANLRELALAFAAIGLTGVIMGACVIFIGLFAAELLILAAALRIVVGALVSLGEANIFKNLEQNFRDLANAAKVLGDNFWLLEGAAFVIFSLGTALVPLGIGLMEVSAAAAMFAAALAIAATSFDLFLIGVSTLSKVVNTIVSAIDQMTTSLKELGPQTVQEIYATLINAANDLLPSAGEYMCELVGIGFANQINDSFTSVINDTVAAITAATAANKQSVMDSAKELGEAWDTGLRDAAGHSYCINDYTDIPDDTDEAISTETKVVNPSINKAAASSGQSYTNGLMGKIGEGLKSIANKIKVWWDKIKAGDFMGAFGLDFSTVIGDNGNTISDEIEKTMERIQNGYNNTNKFRTTYLTGIGYVDHHGKVVEAANSSANAITKSADAFDAESAAAGGNSKATKSNSKAKKENKKENDKKTKAIDEETEALDEETESVEDNEQAIRDQAEEIEIVTERFKDYLNAYKFADPMRNALRLNKAFSKLWSSNDKSLKDVNTSYKKASESLSKSLKTINKQVLAFNNSGKYIGKLPKSIYKNADSIEKKVSKTGKTLMKVMGPSTKVFYKVGNSVETMTITTTKNLRKLGKHFEQAKNFLSSFNAEIEHQESSEEFITNLRGIERFFGATKFGKLATKAQDYIRGIVNEFEEVGNSMNILAKNIDGIGNVLSKKSKASAYVADSFLALAASMYDGSDAANEYATEHEKLLFLMENGLATQEEVDEHFQSYISRLKETIVEYRNSIFENLSGSMDIFSQFNQNLLEEGTDLISNIESQIAGYYNWGNMLMELSKRGFDSGIIKMLTDEGVSSFGKAKALMEMTGNELALFTIRYQQSQAVIEHTTDTALAAVANAQTRASLRAAAAQGDKTAQAQLKQSKKNKKALLDDARAVAEFQAKYKKLSANEEKKYLKSLSKEERKAYKSQLKAAKKQQKDLEKAAKSEEAKRAEESRIATIRESIKTFNDYISTINRYAEDSNVMKSITEDLNEAFKPLTDTVATFTDEMSFEDATKSLLAFAETLEATGTDGNSYIAEMTERLEKYVETLKDSIKNQMSLTSAIKMSNNGYNSNMFVRNLTTNLTAASQVSALMNQLRQKFTDPLVNNILIDISSQLSSGTNIGDILEQLNVFLNMTKSQIMAINAGLASTDEEAKKVANDIAKAVSTATSNANFAERYEKAKDSVTDLGNQLSEAKDKMDSARKTYEYWNAEISRTEATLANASVAVLKLEKKKKDKGKLSKKDQKALEEYKAIIARCNNELSNTRAEATSAKSALDAESKAYEEVASKYNAAMKEYKDAEKAYNEAQANADNIKARQEAELRLEQAAYAVLALVDSYETLISIEKRYANDARVTQKITLGMKDVIKSVSGAIDEYGRRWKNVNKLSETVGKDVDEISYAFVRLSDTLQSTTELSGDFFTDVSNKLSEYRDSLYDTIKGQVSLFDAFNKSSGNKMTSASTYLDNMQSQLTGLEEWLTGLETLAKRGINGDILQVFAAEGQGSYEKVMAFVNATDEQLGELMAKYNEYNALTSAAADRAMAAIGSTYTDAAMKASEDLIDLFRKTGATRLQEEAYNAGLMIINGVKNGIGNALPEITTITGDTADAVSTNLASKIGESVGKAINTGVVQAVSNSIEATVSAAVEKFKMAVNTINTYVQETLKDEWTIVIHVNTSEIDAAVARMNSAIYDINAQANTTQDAYVSSRQAAMPTVEIEPTQPAHTQDVVLNYTQNNYSPSALSRAEIYRQTRNQLSTIEGVVSAATGG